MITDIVLLKVLSQLDSYNQYRPNIDISSLQSETAELIKGYGDFFAKVPMTEINFPIFFDWFCQYLHPELTETQQKYYKLILENVGECQDSLAEDLVVGLRTRQLKSQLNELLITGFNVEKLDQLVAKFKVDVKRYEEQENIFLSNNIFDILAKTDRTEGLQFRLHWLKASLPPLIKGDLGIIGGYVDLGKTTLAMSEAVHMAEQMQHGCLLWLNNEQEERTVQLRLWSSLINIPCSEIRANPQRAEQFYLDKLNGERDRIKIVNIYDKTMHQVAEIIRNSNAQLVVIDRLDKIIMPKMHNNAAHQVKGKIAGDLRQLAKEVCPIIGIVQASSSVKYWDKDAKNMKFVKYPDHDQIHESKVDVSGEADFVIMIGGDNQCPNIRGIHVSKNKFGRTMKFDAQFDGEHARYKDAE